MRLPRTETTLAAALLLSAAPFALAVPPAATPPTTPPAPGTTAPQTAPGTMNPGTSPGAAPQSTAPGTSRPQTQDLQGGNATPGGWSHPEMRPDRTVPESELSAAGNAKVSLTDAINTARRQSHGNVVSARFELRHGKPEYLIRTFDSRSQKEWLGHIDAVTGKVMGLGRSIPLRRLPKDDQQELTASSTAATSLAQAVQTAEQQRGGKPVAAGLVAHSGKVSYRTQLLESNGRTQMAMISPTSGQVSRYR